MSDARLKRERPLITHPVTTLTGNLKVPEVTTELLQYLQQVFNTRAHRDRNPRDYDVAAGHNEVIAHLESLWAEQNEQ
jgi:hypothetical protein